MGNLSNNRESGWNCEKLFCNNNNSIEMGLGFFCRLLQLSNLHDLPGPTLSRINNN